MTDKSGGVEVSEGKAKKKPRFDARDWGYIAEFICDEFKRRKDDRKDREKEWDEVDRQLRMDPKNLLKYNSDGTADNARAWMAEMELPLQAQTLEVLTADARRMMVPTTGPWFTAHAALTDKYLARVDFESLIAGDENDVPSIINQDNADKIVRAFLGHFHRQYDFAGHLDLINAEAFKYGVGIGRVRNVKKGVFRNEARGVARDSQELPVLFPRSIKNTYLDDGAHRLMNEGLVVGSSVIYEKTQSYTDLVLAASKGSNDPKNPDGGWMPAHLRKLEGDKQGNVQLLEFEGDLVVPRRTVSSVYIPGVIVTVAIGKGDKKASAIVRFRFRQSENLSYIEVPYHRENIDSAYATSPLMKGRSVQQMATQAINNFFDAAALQNDPPKQYDRDDVFFAQSGGPMMYPGAQWGTVGDVKTHVAGDPGAMFTAYSDLARQYADLTGTQSPRLGAQTNSHTTAFAKEAELSRGTIRTVDYVNSTLSGPMAQFLDMEYELGKEVMGSKRMDVYSPDYKGFISLNKEALPDQVVFEAHGSGGPSEEREKQSRRLQSLQLALQMDQLNVQQGGQPVVDVPAAIEQVLLDGGWIDTGAITRLETMAEGSSGAPAVSPTGEPAPGASAVALQALANQGA